MTPEERRRKLQEIADQIVERLDREWPAPEAHVNESEDLAAEIAYTGVPQRLRRLGLPIHLGVKSVELIAQRLGEAVKRDPPGVDTVAQRPLAVAVDGVMLPTRDGYKEARSGVIYEPDWAAGRTPEECHGLRKEYVGTLESREALV